MAMPFEQKPALPGGTCGEQTVDHAPVRALHFQFLGHF